MNSRNVLYIFCFHLFIRYSKFPFPMFPLAIFISLCYRLFSWLSHSFKLDYLWHITVSSMYFHHWNDEGKPKIWNRFIWMEWNKWNMIWPVVLAWNALKFIFYATGSSLSHFAAHCHRNALKCIKIYWNTLKYLEIHRNAWKGVKNIEMNRDVIRKNDAFIEN